MKAEREIMDVRDALEIVRSAIHRADDYGKRDLWHIEGYLCVRAQEEWRKQQERLWRVA